MRHLDPYLRDVGTCELRDHHVFNNCAQVVLCMANVNVMCVGNRILRRETSYYYLPDIQMYIDVFTAAKFV